MNSLSRRSSLAACIPGTGKTVLLGPARVKVVRFAWPRSSTTMVQAGTALSVISRTWPASKDSFGLVKSAGSLPAASRHSDRFRSVRA